MDRRRVETKIRRKIKLIKTLPPREKMRWAGYILIISYMTIFYLKGVGLWP